jgi:SAM-dependent methyltransferase
MDNEPTGSPAEVYEQYLGPAIADPWTRVLLGYANPQPGERALDVACGTGSVARHIAPLVGASGKVFALDINPEMLAVGRAVHVPAGARIEWQEGNAMDLPLPDCAFDLVLCQQGVQFFSNPAAALQEMHRVLDDGGRVVLSVWQGLELHPVYQTLFEATVRHLGVPLSDVAVPFSLSDAEELRALLDDAGFRSTAVIPRQLDIRLPSAGRFVQLTILGAATSVPTFSQLDAAARLSLVEAVASEAKTVLQHYSSGDELIFPMFTHIAVGDV